MRDLNQPSVILELLRSYDSWRSIYPTWLGGPGGFVEQLPQTDVRFDTDEIECMDLPCSGSPTSGSSLLCNLNRIRRWLHPAKWFMPRATVPPGVGVYVEPGIAYWGGTTGSPVVWTGETSGSFVHNSGSDPRIDILFFNTATGSLGIEQGTPAPSPVPPWPLSGSPFPIAEVYMRPCSGSIFNSCSSGSAVNNYIYRDVRPFITAGFAADGGDGGAVEWGQVVTVMKTGGDYTSIALAMAAIVDASSSKPYTILLGPGIWNYTAAETWKDWVSIMGMGREASIINLNSTSNDVSIQLGSHASYQDFTVKAAISPFSGFDTDCILASDGQSDILMRNIDVDWTITQAGAVSLSLIKFTTDGGALSDIVCEHVRVRAVSNASSGTIPAWWISTTGVVLRDCEGYAEVGSGSASSAYGAQIKLHEAAAQTVKVFGGEFHQENGNGFGRSAGIEATMESVTGDHYIYLFDVFMHSTEAGLNYSCVESNHYLYLVGCTIEGDVKDIHQDSGAVDVWPYIYACQFDFDSIDGGIDELNLLEGDRAKVDKARLTAPNLDLGIEIGYLEMMRGFKDDFLGDALHEQYTPVSVGAGSGGALQNNFHGGAYRLTAGATNGFYHQLWLGNAVDGFATLDADLGWIQIARFALSHTTTITGDFGAIDAASNNIILAGLNTTWSANWSLITRIGGGGVNVVDTGVAPDTNPHEHVLNVYPDAGARRVDYWLDGDKIATTTVSVPTAVITPIARCWALAAAARDNDLDFWGVTSRNL